MKMFVGEGKKRNGLKGFGRMDVFALLLCIGAFCAMLLSIVHYRGVKKSVARANQEQKEEGEKLYFWETLNIPPADANRMINQAMNVFQYYTDRAVDISQKASCISDGYKQIGKMTAYYAHRPFEILLLDPQMIRFGGQKIHGVDYLMVVLEFKNGAVWDLGFYKDKEGLWKLDWPAFVRYQGMDWEQFVLGDGVFPEGVEFRVWAEREKTLENTRNYAIRFTAPPHPGVLKEGVSSPVVYIDKESEMGKEFYRYYRINELMPVENRISNTKDDPARIRLKVVLSKETREDGSKQIKLKKIISEGWHGEPPE